jgi:outer membrane protein
MKKTIFLLILTLISVPSFAQKFGYIDSEFITSKMPEYKKAQEDIDKYSEKWVSDIQVKYSELEKMRQQFQQEEILLTAEMKRERQKNIDDKEAEIKELNNTWYLHLQDCGIQDQLSFFFVKQLFEDYYYSFTEYPFY